MIALGDPNRRRPNSTPMPVTLLPLIYDPVTGNLSWLNPRWRTVASPCSADGRVSLAAAAPVPPTDDLQVRVVTTLLHDLATVTCRPLRCPPRPHRPTGTRNTPSSGSTTPASRAARAKPPTRHGT